LKLNQLGKHLADMVSYAFVLRCVFDFSASITGCPLIIVLRGMNARLDSKVPIARGCWINSQGRFAKAKSMTR
jgi:hypothetical protein